MRMLFLPLLSVLGAASAQEQECPGWQLRLQVWYINQMLKLTGLMRVAWDATSSWMKEWTSPGWRLRWPVSRREASSQNQLLSCEKTASFKIVWILSFLRQLDFLSELALLEGGFTGVSAWYIGLTDLGKKTFSWVKHPTVLHQERRVSGPGFTVA